MKNWAWGSGALALVILALPGLVRADDDKELFDLQTPGKILFMLSDANRDGQISQKEATDGANLMVGGFFFRADANGDGVLSQEEAKQAREAFLQGRPWLRYVIDTTRATVKQEQNASGNQANPMRALLGVLDANNDRQIQAAELRQMVESAVQGFFAQSDTNRDGQLSPTEVNAASYGIARSVAQASFQAADTDNNGSLSQEEWNKALEGPSKVVFNILDGNNDNQITQQEAQQAQQVVWTQLRSIRIPDADNAPQDLLRTGRRPDEVAPVPAFGTPNAQGQPGRAPAPAPATPNRATPNAPAAPRAPQ